MTQLKGHLQRKANIAILTFVILVALQFLWKSNQDSRGVTTGFYLTKLADISSIFDMDPWRIPRRNFHEFPRANRTHQSPMLFYPLALPSLDQVIRDLLNGKGTDVNPINDAYFHMGFLNMSANPCAAGTEPELLILIKSGPANRKRRGDLRSTWANATLLATSPVAVGYAFLVGKPKGEMAAGDLKNEIERYGDVIMMNFTDSYRNLSYKTVGGMRWAAEYCPSTAFTIIVDDDMYVAVDRLVEYLQYPRTYPNIRRNGSVDEGWGSRRSGWKWGFDPDEHVYAGVLSKWLRPVHRPNSKHFVTWEDFPLKKYPNYILGPTTILSRRTLNEFLVASLFVKGLNIDDAYLGVIASKLRVTPRHIPQIAPFGYANVRRWKCSVPGSFHEVAISVSLASELKRRKFVDECKAGKKVNATGGTVSEVNVTVGDPVKVGAGSEVNVTVADAGKAAKVNVTAAGPVKDAKVNVTVGDPVKVGTGSEVNVTVADPVKSGMALKVNVTVADPVKAAEFNETDVDPMKVVTGSEVNVTITGPLKVVSGSEVNVTVADPMKAGTVSKVNTTVVDPLKGGTGSEVNVTVTVPEQISENRTS